MPLVAPVGRRLAARAIDIALSLLVLWIVSRLVPEPRVVARMVVAFGAIAAFEALFVLQLRATPGKLATGLRVAELDRATIDPTTAWIRGAVTTIGSVAVILVIPAVAVMSTDGLGLVVGGMVLVVAAGYALAVVGVGSDGRGGRGPADRIAGTIVVPFEAPGIITLADLEDADGAKPRTWTAWGPVATMDARRRARAARLDDAPLLVVVLVGVSVAWTFDAPAVAIGLVVLFAIVLVVDEATRIGRDGGTAGHRREGLAVLDESTGEAPGRGAAYLRSVTFAVFWLFPPLLLVLALWVQLSRTGRGPHDLVAGTVVVEVAGPSSGDAVVGAR